MAEYNGWTNYETWNCALWLDNEQSSQSHWQERAEETLKEADGDKEEAEKPLADELEAWVDENTPSIPPSMYSDMLGSCLREINYREIASHWLADIELETEE